MRRKDGRELVTEHPVIARDRIGYIHRDDLPPLGVNVLVCDGGITRRDPFPDDLDDGDIGDWGA